MTVKCKECGVSYDKKYNICPSCGAVRFSLPLYSKIIAAVAAAYLVLTAVLFPLGVFTLEGDNDGAAGSSKVTAEPPVNEVVISPAPMASEPPPSDTPTPSTPAPKPVTREITIRSELYTYDEHGFTLYIGDGALKLEAVLEPEPDGPPEITWKSSDKTVFTVSGEGLVTPLAPGTATLSAAFGGAQAQISVIIREGSMYGMPATSSAPTLAPTPQPTHNPSPAPSPGVTPSPEPTQPPEETPPPPTPMPSPTPTSTPPPTKSLADPEATDNQTLIRGG